MLKTLRLNSSKIAPFRKYSKGYTGQRNIAYRDFALNYSYQVTLLNKIEKIIDSEFLCFEDPNDCTQFIRGEIYTYFDSLMSLPASPSASDINKIFEFATIIFRMCLKWI